MICQYINTTEFKLDESTKLILPSINGGVWNKSFEPLNWLITIMIVNDKTGSQYWKQMAPLGTYESKMCNPVIKFSFDRNLF